MSISCRSEEQCQVQIFHIVCQRFRWRILRARQQLPVRTTWLRKDNIHSTLLSNKIITNLEQSLGISVSNWISVAFNPGRFNKVVLLFFIIFQNLFVNFKTTQVQLSLCFPDPFPGLSYFGCKAFSFGLIHNGLDLHRGKRIQGSLQCLIIMISHGTSSGW